MWGKKKEKINCNDTTAVRYVFEFFQKRREKFLDAVETSCELRGPDWAFSITTAE